MDRARLVALAAMFVVSCRSPGRANVDAGAPGDGGSTPDAASDGGADRGDAGTPPPVGHFAVVTGFGPSRGHALEARLSPVRVATDGDGEALFVTSQSAAFRLETRTGTLTHVAGAGPAGFLGDGDSARVALLSLAGGIAVDASGNVYLADTGNNRVRRIASTTGTIATIAGIGSTNCPPCYSGDNGPATGAALDAPSGLALDANGDLYVADSGNFVVRKIDGRTGVITTIAGNGTRGSAHDGVPATTAALTDPEGVALDGEGHLLIADRGDARVRSVDLASGVIGTVAGSGVAGSSGDGGPAKTAAVEPSDVAVDASHAIWIADAANHRIRRVDPDGTIATIAGMGVPGFGGDGQDSKTALLFGPTGISIAKSGDVFIADSRNGRVRRIRSGQITTVAGIGIPGAVDDGRPATSVALTAPAGLAIDSAMNVYFSDAQRIRKIDALTERVFTVAGAGIGGPARDGIAAVEAELDGPSQIALDDHAHLFIAEKTNNLIRRVDFGTHLIATVAGGGAAGMLGDGGPATHATLLHPSGVAIDHLGNLAIADTAHNRVRLVDASTQVVTTIAGTGVAGFSGDTGLAAHAQLSGPTRVRFDATGNLFIADYGNARVRRIDAGSKKIQTVAGNGSTMFTRDGDPALSTPLVPVGLEIDANGDLFISDESSHRIRKVDAATHVVSTVIGDGQDAVSGDGGPAVSAALSMNRDLALSNAGDLYVSADSFVRSMFKSTGTIITAAGAVAPIDDALDTAALGAPTALVALPSVATSSVWLIADGASGRIRKLDRTMRALTTVAGYPHGSSSEGTSALFSRLLQDPAGVAFDPSTHRLFVSERAGATIRVVDTSSGAWTIGTFAGRLGSADWADAAPLDSRFDRPAGLAIDAGRRILYVADSGNHVVRSVAIDAQDARFKTIAGTPKMPGFSSTLFRSPEALAVATDGSVYVADTGNDCVRRIDVGKSVSTVLANIDSPRGLAFGSDGTLYVAARHHVYAVTQAASVTTIFGPSIAAMPGLYASCLSGIAVTSASLLVLDACAGFALEISLPRM
jgi:sugar lactone lactonase YvrE